MKQKISEFGKISKCVLLSFITTLILCGLFSVAVSIWDIEESTAKTVVFAMMAVSVIFGAFVLAKNIEHSGLLNGLIMAVFYFAVIMLLSLIINGKSAFGATHITKFITIAASGMLGGILGVNT